MHCTRPVTTDIHYVGSSDRRLALFESAFPIPRGISYNSYLVLDEKTLLLDTVDRSVAPVFFENIEYLLNGRPLDYLVVNHMEPDHAATIRDLRLRHPETEIVATQKALDMIGQFFDPSTALPCRAVKEGDTLSTGKHSFSFVTAPMVHWPEVMVTYESTDGILFSADAFGTFGALSNLFADEFYFGRDWIDDARRYYTNIVGKYGVQVQNLLKKAAGLDIRMICPLHGPIWREHLEWFIDKYQKWSTYTPEENGVLIAYASVYGDTENAASILANELAMRGVRNISLHDVSVTHPSVIVAEAFRFSHLVFASTTYNMGIFVNMEIALNDIKAHALQNRKVAVIENGSWAPNSGKLMKEELSSMKNITLLEQGTTLKSSVKENNLADIRALADAIAADLT